MDRIVLSNLKYFGYHGCDDFEKKQGQIFELDIELFCDLSTPCRTDSLADAVNYVEIAEKVKQVMEKERYNLLERVAQRVSEVILDDARIERTVVRIRKPDVSLSGVLDYVQIEIIRDRQL